MLLFGICGGQIAKNNERPFWLGFAIGIFGNILGIVLLMLIFGNQVKSFEPEFNDQSRNKITTIQQLSNLNERGHLSDDEFERLKKEIIKSDH